MCFYILLTILLSQIHNARPTNHYSLKDDGLIKRRLDSPFHLREPDSLYIFIEQIHYNENAEEAFRKMQRKRTTLDEHILITSQLLQEILDRSKCARMYVKLTGLSDYLLTTAASMKRLKFPEKFQKDLKEEEPICTNYAQLESGYLKSFNTEFITTLHIEQEENLLKHDLDIKDAAKVTTTIHEISLKGLQSNPTAWKFHMLASYYWRLTGHAKNAIECARIAIKLAPAEDKDIPLLSLGTILVRAEQWDDAEIVLNDAVKYGPNHGENYIVLATLQALKHDFKRARQNFKHAEKLDENMYNNSLKMRQYIECLEPLDTNATKLFGFVKYMLREIKEVSKLRQEISFYQSKIVQQQVSMNNHSVIDNIMLNVTNLLLSDTFGFTLH